MRRIRSRRVRAHCVRSSVREDGDADAAPDEHFVRVDDEGIFEGADDGFRHHPGVLRAADRREQDAELVAAHSRDRPVSDP
jgi:hypothetical protein